MQKAKQKTQKNKYEFLVMTGILIILLLTTLNITKILEPNRVLGVKTVEAKDDTEFWRDFLKKHPNYLPGWLAIGRLDKIKEIDPNFKMESGD